MHIKFKVHILPLVTHAWTVVSTCDLQTRVSWKSEQLCGNTVISLGGVYQQRRLKIICSSEHAFLFTFVHNFMQHNLDSSCACKHCPSSRCSEPTMPEVVWKCNKGVTSGFPATASPVYPSTHSCLLQSFLFHLLLWMQHLPLQSTDWTGHQNLLCEEFPPAISTIIIFN